MSYSAKVRIRTDYGKDRLTGEPRRCREDGTGLLYLQVIINRKVWPYPLDEFWYEAHFDEQLGQVRARRREDFRKIPQGWTSQGEAKRVADINLNLQRALSDANEIFLRYRLQDIEPTVEDFKREFRSSLNKGDFIAYFEAKALERLKSKEIEQLTYDTHISSLKVLKKFAKELPFSALAAKDFAQKFETFQLSKGHRATTRWARHKDVKTYLKLARTTDRIIFADPYQNFKPKKGKSSWRALPQRDVSLLVEYYRTTTPGDRIRPVLRRWLFALASCGMRISDQRRVERDWRFDNLLIFKPWKGRRKLDKLIKVLLTPTAIELWNDALREQDHKRYVFTDLSGAKANDWLRELGQELGLSSKVFNHAARKTFGSLYLANGGLLHHLQDYFGHADISATMLYVDVMPDTRVEEVNKVEAIFAKGRRVGTLLGLSSPSPEPEAGRMRPLSWFVNQDLDEMQPQNQ